MEKKLRSKFILMSMLALLVVLVLLFGSINIVNYVVNTRTQDTILERITAGGFRMPPPDMIPDLPFGFPVSPESSAMTRFFTVSIDKNGEVTSKGMDFISSVNAEEAEEYANKVLDNGKKSGYLGEYRYLVYENNNGTSVTFLNSASQLQQIRTILLLSLLLGTACFILMFILVLIFSKRAVAPYMKNVEIQKRFITDASHELKTPLTAISTSADVLALDDSANEWIMNIRNQTQKMSKLVSNLVMMSRLDEEHPIPEKYEFPLSEALWESTEPFSATAKATGKNFEVHIEEGMKLFGDVVSFQQMISVLLDNALKYSNDGGYIRLDAYRKKTKICIEVFNTCEQIDIKNLNRLFDRFYRADPSRSGKTGGTGVGLSIAKAIANAHGGNITVKSQSGNSIVFKVII